MEEPKTFSIEVEERNAYFVYVNKDLTEGRGPIYVKHTCNLKSTALRLAKGADVQGRDAAVHVNPIFKVAGEWYGPVFLNYGTGADAKEEIKLVKELAEYEKGLVAISKAKAAGLTDEDIISLLSVDKKDVML